MNIVQPMVRPVVSPMLVGDVGGSTLLPLQMVGPRGEICRQQSATGQRNCNRSRHYLGGKDVRTLSLLYGNWWIGPGSEANGDYAFDIQAAIEYNGVTVPCTWSGVNMRTFAPGDQVATDEIPASAFGLEVFPAGAQFWVRCERTRGLGQTLVVFDTTAYSTAITGEGCVYKTTTVDTQVFNTGALTTAGGWTSSGGSIQFFPLAILGRPVSPLMALYVVGASKEYGQSDSGGDGNNDGGGYIRRAAASAGGARIPYHMAVVSSQSILGFNGFSTRQRTLLQYATHIISGLGGNDYSNGQTIANTLTRLDAHWALLKATGLPTWHVLEMPKTNSTDSWATVANQTPRTDYQTGGTWRDAFNARIAARVSDLTLAGAVDLNATVADGTALDKWGAPGYTGDGTHPSKTRQIALATPMATWLAARKTEYEGG